jgi:glycosyltransferase involved in cell wall biosynthesis
MWRVWQPFEELQRRGFVADWCPKDDSGRILPWIAAGRYDAILTPRIVWPAQGIGDIWIEAIHKAGLCWIYEVDDDVFTPRIVERQYRLFETERVKGRDQLEWERQERVRLLGMCDGITVTTQRLATIIRAYVSATTPVYTVPNAIDARWFKETLRGYGRIKELEGRLTIGWAGGTREDIDVLPLAEAWAEIARRYPEVVFVVQGHIPAVLADSVPKDRRYTLPWLPLDEYPRALLNLDIGCCIVAPVTFNTAKSCIKWYEMTLAGAACVVSKTLYGREANQFGYTDALVADNAEEWIERLSRLVEDAGYRRALWRNARRTVMEHHSLEQNWWRWPDAWADAIERFRSKPRLILAKA